MIFNFSPDSGFNVKFKKISCNSGWDDYYWSGECYKTIYPPTDILWNVYYRTANLSFIFVDTSHFVSVGPLNDPSDPYFRDSVHIIVFQKYSKGSGIESNEDILCEGVNASSVFRENTIQTCACGIENGEHVNAVLYDIQGRKISSLQESIHTENEPLSFPYQSDALPKGVYILILNHNGISASRKVVKW